MRRIVAILVLGVLLAGCSGAGDGADNTKTLGPATTQAAATGNIDGSFDVGGHKLHLRCEGKSAPGSPTVVYLHGLGGDGSDVKSINTPLASQVRVCTYDRLNVGRSDRVTGRHTGADSVADLHTLLKAAGVPGPYLLVGFSFGGLLAIMYAGAYPDQVMGLVSLDGSLPTDDQVDRLIPKDERAQVMAEQERNQESVDFYRTLDQAKTLVAKVPASSSAQSLAIAPRRWSSSEPIDPTDLNDPRPTREGSTITRNQTGKPQPELDMGVARSASPYPVEPKRRRGWPIGG